MYQLVEVPQNTRDNEDESSDIDQQWSKKFFSYATEALQSFHYMKKNFAFRLHANYASYVAK